MKENRKSGNIVVSFMLFITVIFALCAFAVDMTIFVIARQTIQRAAEQTALETLSVIKYNDDYKTVLTNEEEFKTRAYEIFSLFKVKKSFLENAKIESIKVKPASRAVSIKIQAPVKTYFLNFLGLGLINIEAQASAKNDIFWLNKSLPIILNSSGKVVLKGPLVDDTLILNPLGRAKNQSIKDNKILYENILKAPDSKALSFGEGGYITLRLPYPVVDKEGEEFYIKEAGVQEGYFVFAGVDANPNNPYLDSKNPGEGIKWVNISCTARPKNNLIRTYKVTINSNDYVKVYGSAFFDIGASCSDGSYNKDISLVKYLKIIDDNSEDGFNNENSTSGDYYIGESSSPSAGADIDAIGVTNFAKLIKTSYFDSL